MHMGAMARYASHRPSLLLTLCCAAADVGHSLHACSAAVPKFPQICRKTNPLVPAFLATPPEASSSDDDSHAALAGVPPQPKKPKTPRTPKLLLTRLLPILKTTCNLKTLSINDQNKNATK